MTEAEWLTSTDPVAMQQYMLGKNVAVRRVQLLVVACGDLIWGVMRPAAQTAFEALLHTAEGTDTEAHRKRLGECGPLKEWLDWCLGIGGRTPPLYAAAAALVREVFGNPFRPAAFSPEWRTDTAVALARQMYESRDFGAMPILADALQDAGCDNEDILSHCRDIALPSSAVVKDSPVPAPKHVRGCWVIDLVLGRQ